MKLPLAITESRTSRSQHDYLTTERYSRMKYSSGGRYKRSPETNSFEEEAE
jgi:hypothetical protein